MTTHSMSSDRTPEQDVLMHFMLYTTSSAYRQARIPYSSANHATSVAGPSRSSKRTSATTIDGPSRRISKPTLTSSSSPSSHKPVEDLPSSTSSPTQPPKQVSPPATTTPLRTRPTWAHITPLSVSATFQNSLLAQAFKSRFGKPEMSQAEIRREKKTYLEEEEVDELATPKRGWFGRS